MKLCKTEGCQAYTMNDRVEYCASCLHDQRKLERESSKPPKPLKPMKTKELKDSHVWIPFSKFIRLRDSDENGICTCFTCGEKQTWNSGGMQAGHFIGRRHWATRYDEQNVHAQCATCNQFNGGMQFEYGLKIDIVYGPGTALKLKEKSNELTKFTEEELYALAAHYRRRVKELLMKIKPAFTEPHKI